MKITFLGTCAGTEPMPGRHHGSFVVEHDGGVYWFDAGETCSYTAHLAGIDLLSTRAIFITHTHMDHVGGLGNLLWTLRKLQVRAEPDQKRLSGRTVPVLIPNLTVWRGVMQVLGGTEGAFGIDFSLAADTYADGTIYDDGALRVLALHNTHLGPPADGEGWKSFSFRIEVGGRSIVYSGDVKSVEDLAPLLDAGCDVFLMETGHHTAQDVCSYLAESGKDFGRLGFIHHGRAILTDPAGELAKAVGILGERVFLADDGEALTIP